MVFTTFTWQVGQHLPDSYLADPGSTGTFVTFASASIRDFFAASSSCHNGLATWEGGGCIYTYMHACILTY
jgi:hypothetical protein